ncbi:MAG: nitroreductase [Bacillota bacterium]|nr:nitroreductase [Bacillota bacterium]
MNEAIKTILNRRSTRKYTEKQIKDEELETILEAGRFAPSGMNKQPWHFTVVQNKEILHKINEGCKIAMQRSADDKFNAFYNAPTVIIVACDENVITSQFDGALALGNMFLAAEALGIGSCWIHAIKFSLETEVGKSILKDLGIPEGYTVVGSGAFGYKAMESQAPPRKEGTVTILK